MLSEPQELNTFTKGLCAKINHSTFLLFVNDLQLYGNTMSAKN